jgi:hypothetical protein
MFAFICTNTNYIVVKTNRLLALNRFIFLYFSLLATLAHGQQTFPPRYFFPGIEFDHLTTNKMVVKNTIGKETPVAMAYWVPGKAHEYDNQLTDDEIHKLDWQPFKPEILVDLGAGTGTRNVWLVAKWENPTEYQQEELRVTVDAEMPSVVITNPTNSITFQSLLRLQGYCSGYMMYPQYDISNATDVTLNQDAYGTDSQGWDEKKFDWTKFCFEAVDIALAPGTNSITFHCEIAGNWVSTNIVLVFTTVGDTNPPDFKLRWPNNGDIISDSEFDMDGTCDDPSAQIEALVCDDQGNATHRNGSVGRNSLGQDGFFIVERVPLSEGMEYITLVASDPANNSSLVNITVGKSDDVLYMDPIANPQELWQGRISKVTGYYSRTNHPVSVNGVKAKMKPDGHWEADNVPNDIANSHFEMTADGADDRLTPSHVWQPIDLGEPTNSLRAGISFVSVSTNEYNHYPICLGITNISGTNQPRNWMLPTFDRRFALRLLDKDGKAVAKREYFQKSGEVLPDNLDIHHLGKNELTNIDGIIPFATNMAVQLASINLDEHFQMPPPGDYRLEVEERLFQIGGDGHLIPITLPPVMSDLKVIDQPSEMTFYLRHLEQQKKLFWGPALNLLRVGVVNSTDNHTSGRTAEIEIFLENLGTNAIRNLRLPRLEEQFDVSLFDTNGMEVAKTALGKQRGLPLTITNSSSDGIGDIARAIFGNVRRPKGFRPVFLSGKDVTEIGSVNLNELFEINSPGKYRLTYQQRFIEYDSTNKPTGLTMPTVIVPLDMH